MSGDLFGQAHARSGDPVESHAAARSVTNQTTIRDQIVVFLAGDPGTFEDLFERFDRWAISYTESGVRTRTRELVDAGLVESHPTRKGVTRSGRACAIWELTLEGRRYAHTKGWLR